MKKNFLLMTVCLIISGFLCTLHAKIWRVNNTGVPADFTTVQAAINAGTVNAGDTIHVEPSGTSYGGMQLTKRLVIIGNGYFLGSPVNNANPGLQANTANSTVGQVSVYAAASNSVIMGLTCSDIYIGWDAVTSNVVFKRNFCTTLQVYSGGTNNTVISQNYVTTFLGGTAGTHTNLVITNNIIGAYVQFDGNDNGFFANNIFSALSGAWIQMTGFTVRNNIRVQAQPGTVFTNCTIQNNMDCAGGSIFGTNDGNLSNVDMSTVFVGYPTTGSNSTDGRFALKSGSPAGGTGYGGADMGAILNTGNANNNLADTYVLSGMPNVPSVFKLDAPVTVTTSTMNVTISTRTNN